MECTRNSSCKCPMCDMSAETAMLETQMQQDSTLAAAEAPEAAADAPGSPNVQPAAPAAAVANSPPLPAAAAAAVANSPPLPTAQAAVAPAPVAPPTMPSEFPEGAGAAPAEDDYSALPLAERLVHKKWNVRKAACEALGAAFGGDDAVGAAAAYAPMLPKLVKDSSAKVQDASLDAVLGFLRANVAPSSSAQLELAEPPKLLPALLRAAFNGRGPTIAKGKAALVAAVEAGLGAATLTALLDGIGEKKPKVPPLCVATLGEIVAAFGASALGKEPMLLVFKKIKAVMESLNGAVRDGGLALITELLRWVPPAALESHCEGLRKAQETAVKELFSAAPPLGTACPSHFVGGADAAAAKAAAGGGGAANAAAAAREFAEDVDLVKALSKTSFAEDAAAKGEKLSWKKRVAALDLLLSTVGPLPKLMGSGAEHSEVVATLTKLATDANAQIMVKATKGLGALANGLGKEFSVHARATLKLMLGLLKNKTTLQKTATFDALDALADSSCVTLEQEKTRGLFETTISHVKTKAAPARENAMAWLARRVELDTDESARALSDGALGWIASVYTSALADTDTKCRKAVMAGLGSLLRRCPEAVTGAKFTGAGPVGAVLAKAPATHQKVLESLLKASASKAPAKPRRSLASEASKPAAASGDAAPAAAGPKKLKLKKDKKPSSSSSSSSSSADAAPSSGGTDEGGGDAADADTAMLDAEEAERRLLALGVEAAQLECLGSAKWMEQESGLEAMRAAIEALPEGASAGPHAEPALALLGAKLAKLKDFRHSHAKVMKALLDLIIAIAARSTAEAPFPRKLLKHIVPAAVDKLADKKVAEASGTALMALSEAVAPAPVAVLVLAQLSKAKIPAVLAGGLGFLGTCASEFGVKAMADSAGKTVVAHAKSGGGLSHSNATIRTAAMDLLTVMYAQLGPALDAQVEDVKPTLLKTLKAAFEKVGFDAAGAKAAGPKRTARGAAAAPAAKGAGGGPNLGEQVKAHLEDMMVTEGKDAWKKRNEAINATTAVCESIAKVASVTEEYAEPSRDCEQLIRNLSKRLASESQPNVKVRAARLVGLVGSCLGPKCAKYSKLIGDELLKCAADNKKAMRDTALGSLQAWTSHGGAISQSAIESLLSALPVAMSRPVGRTELLQWLAAAAGACDLSAKSAQLEEFVKPAFDCLLDKTPEARVAAETVLVELVKYVPREQVDLLLGDLKPAAIRTIRPIVTKVCEAVSSSSSSSSPATAGDGKAADEATTGGGVAAAPAAVGKKEDEVDRIEKKVSHALKASASSNGAEDGMLRKGKAGAKGRRADKARRMKWSIEDSGPTAEHRTELKESMIKYVHGELYDKLFADGFQQTIEALRLLSVATTELPEETLETLDLLLKWCTLQLCSNNTNVLGATLDYLLKLFDGLGARGYQLQDFEAECFLPVLVEKAGHNKARFREKLRSLMRLACTACATPAKYVGFIMGGLGSKNMRSRSACLEELERLLPETGAAALGKKAPAQIARLADAAEKDVREAAVSVMAQLHAAFGREGRADSVPLFWKALGCDVPSKVKDMVNTRIKVEEKKRAAEKPAPAPTAADRAAAAGAVAATPSGAKAAADKTAAAGATPALRFATPCHTPAGENAGPTPHHVAISPSDVVDCGGGNDPYTFDDSHIVLATPPSAQRGAALDVEAFDSRFGEVLQRFVAMRALYAPGAPRARAEFPASPLYTQGRDALKIIFRMAAASQGAPADDQRVALLARHAEAIFGHVSECIDNAFGALVDDIDLSLLALSLAVLCALFKIATVAAALPASVLSATLESVIVRLPDHRLASRACVAAESAQKLVGALNMVVLQAVETAPRPRTYGALLALLQRCVGLKVRDSKATQLAVKLFVKVIKMDLKGGEPPFAALGGAEGTEVVLTALHGFFAAVPAGSSLFDDAPFKAANTLLRTLLTEGAISAERMACLPAASPMHALLRTHEQRIKEGPRAAAAAASEAAPALAVGAAGSAASALLPAAGAPVAAFAPAAPVAAPAAAGPAAPMSDDELRAHLGGVFTRLCDPASADDTVRELHTFKASRPELAEGGPTQLFEFLPSMSGVFKAYLQGELEKMDRDVVAEARAAAKADAIAAAAAAAAAATATAAAAAAAATAGATTPAVPAAAAANVPSQVAALPPAPPVQTASLAASSDEIGSGDTKENGGGSAVDSLRARLSRASLATSAKQPLSAAGGLSALDCNTAVDEVAPSKPSATATTATAPAVAAVAPAPAAIMSLKERLAALKQSTAGTAKQTFG